MFECIVTLSDFSFVAICKVQPLNHIDKLLLTAAHSLLCLCVVFTGSKTEEAAQSERVNTG